MHFPKNSLRENIEILIGGALLLGFVSTPQSIDIYGTPKPLSSCAIRQQSAVFSPKIAALGFRKTADVFQKKSLQFFFMPRFLNLHVSNANAASWWDVALSISQFEMVLFLMPFNDKDFCLQKMSSISPFETFYLFSWIFIWWLQIFCKSPLMCFMEVQKLQEDFFPQPDPIQSSRSIYRAFHVQFSRKKSLHCKLPEMAFFVQRYPSERESMDF